jgi:Uncharacterized conserved protein
VKTFVYTINLKNDPEKIEMYKNYHKSVWLEVEESLKSVGILRMRIFLLGTRMVNIVETVDEFNPECDFARYTENKPIVEKWDKLMSEFQEKVAEAKESEWWALMEPVYELGE